MNEENNIDDLMKDDRKIRVINCIRKHGPISRTDICNITMISKPSISRIMDEFIKSGLVIETGIMEADSKRKPVGLELNGDKYYCIGINVSKNTMRTVLTNFKMEIIYKSLLDIKKINNSEFLLKTINQSIRDLINQSGISESRILGAGIGIPGIVDNKNGVIVDFASESNIKNVKLRQHLESLYDFKIFVDNDANTQVLGEYWYGYSVGYENSIFVSCREGIGSGIISGGNVLRGKNNMTGEFGHMIVNPFGRQCSCGRYGCIEAYSSTEAIENIVKGYIKSGKLSLVSKCVENINDLNYKMISQCAFDGDKLCLKCLQDSANILSLGIVNLIEVLNPEIVILSGELFDINDTFYEMVVEYTRENLFNSFSQDVVFVKRSISDSLYEIGAAAMVYKDFFKE
jgi:predicted NBD/HSP70 family sugar kinase